MQTNRHLIALDLDGTLLTDKKEISPRTKQLIWKAMDEGHIVVIATGRPHRASINYYKNLGLSTPMVNFNGALIHHPQDSKWDALHSPMPIRTAHKIVEACYELNVHNVLAEVMDEVYLDQYDQAIIDIFHMTQNDPPFTIGSLKNKLREDPTSILIHPKEDHITTLRQHLDQYHADLIEHRKWGAPWNIIEIVRKGMNKAVGLQKVAHYYHIPKERIIAFGDEDNDLEMIDYAGVGVAMGNAIDELKAVAKHITDTNEEDGIGNFLQEYLKLEVESV
ncbi:Cof-type HAD-IIB family hydrolase [Virgibacillus sp. AGTR]|uniref:HAD family hydrolase n=1 Tax=Virgibacillus TaxID=84406 RepID=UPI000417FDBB|nr:MULTISPECIES: HAD family hydrolase [Bacillaceae]MCC2251662.1 Cof-type HAD-IIB family hydrolase [Virgibacillus sp. AGTR]MDY7045406.1 HAD family hydrolase [Virgibacillus sp. M23]QRZ16517.1 HAD family phosphatase [Virgibacillus sp. AGTR]WBX79994.1 HAD family hydrolase [Virgibacillus salarius]